MVQTLRLLVIALTVVLAGCAGVGGVGTESPEAALTDTATPIPTTNTSDQPPHSALNRTPTDALECDPLQSRSLPDRPSNLTQESVIQFTEQYAQASVWNEHFAGEHIQNAGVSTDGFLITQTESGYVIHVTVEFFSEGCNDSYHADSPLYGYDYFLNESLIAVNTNTMGEFFTSPADHRHVPTREILQNGTVKTRWNMSSE